MIIGVSLLIFNGMKIISGFCKSRVGTAEPRKKKGPTEVSLEIVRLFRPVKAQGPY